MLTSRKNREDVGVKTKPTHVWQLCLTARHSPAAMVAPRDLPVCQWSDHKPRGIAKILIGVEELGITDVGEAVPLLI